MREKFAGLPKKAAHNVLEQAHCLLLYQLVHHVTKHCANSVEAFVCLADVGQANVVEQNLLYDENGDRLAEFRPCLHDTQTKWDDLGGEKEVDDLGRVVLDKRANNTKRCKTEVFERTGLGGSVEERVEEERDVCCGCISAWLSPYGYFYIPLKKSPRVSV